VKTGLRTLIVVVASALTAQLASLQPAEAATKKTTIHKKHHKHTFRDLPANDPAGSLRTGMACAAAMAPQITVHPK
jgi:hypothetical protein